MNCKGLGRKQSSYDLCIVLVFAWMDWRKPQKDLSQDNWCSEQDLSQACPRYNFRVLITTHTCSMVLLTLKMYDSSHNFSYLTVSFTSRLLCLTLKNVFFPCYFLVKILYTFLIISVHMTMHMCYMTCTNKQNKQTPWSDSVSELYRPSDRRLTAKLVPTFADRGCHVVSVMDPYSRILGFLDQSRYFSIK
jgi:hypothetical protein